VQALSTPPARPLAVTVIALFQGFLASYFLYFVTFAYLNPPNNLGSLRAALRLLVGRTDPRSYVRSPHEEIALDLFLFSIAALVIAAYGAITGWGLWKLEKWARHYVAGGYGVMALLWARSFLFFGVFGGFSRVPAATLQPIYIVVFIEAMISMTLVFHGGVAEAFGEVE
jgi:uncharacterized membrane protein (DUF2068 family)